MKEEKTASKQIRENKASKKQWIFAISVWVTYVASQIFIEPELFGLAFIFEVVIFTFAALFLFMKLGLPMTKAACKDFVLAVRPEGELKEKDKKWMVKYFGISFFIGAIFFVGLIWLVWK